jgi:rubredoxin
MKAASSAQAANRLAPGVGVCSNVGDMKAKRQCPHCGNASHQQSLTGAQKLATIGMEVYRCRGCGCIYDRSTGAKLTFALP